MAGRIGQSTPSVHVVVTCANRKRQVIPEHLQLHVLHKSNVDRRCDEWVTRLSAMPSTTPASEMYAGEHWQIAKTLDQVAGEHASLWVCSAGYGLIPNDAPISPYAATLAVGQIDSVAGTVEGTRRWWTRLANWPGPRPGYPRSFAELAGADPDRPIVAALSESYLRACSDDLLEAAAKLTDNSLLSIIGPRGRCQAIDEFIVPVSAALRPAIGGSLLSLNVRAAARILEIARDRSVPFRRPHLTQLMAEVTAAAPEERDRRPPGVRLSDDEVRRFIVQSLNRGGPTSATRLLRRLRASGKSCEQVRFKALFDSITASGTLF
ncbi:hypothetical protein [Allonocardiopsis opalescens]|uniref:Uncharacterized protein n=1 Tax=Allonocardiopsis opalescens TaxID=1144618 RepID=A0A2T0Q2K7_9ACTN|nr:hypothetical protein [Allonocardiopsis opalescens]PRX98019.1 hypothetical protein CLV72_105372 [Allonocardiopsis opalescens]